jgi:hypothetical protein
MTCVVSSGEMMLRTVSRYQDGVRRNIDSHYMVCVAGNVICNIYYKK